MAKDDYNVIVFKILMYYYGIMKRKYSFDKKVFEKTISKENIADGYLNDILNLMQKDNLMQGMTFTKAWGNEIILSNDLEDAKITSDGIRYLSDNSKMEEIKELLLKTPGLIAELIKIVI